MTDLPRGRTDQPDLTTGPLEHAIDRAVRCTVCGAKIHGCTCWLWCEAHDGEHRNWECSALTAREA